MKKTIIALSLLAFVANEGYAQKKKTTTTTTTTSKTATTKSSGGYIPMAGGLEYKILKDVPGANNPKTGDYVEVHLVTTTKVASGDTLLFNTRTMNNGQPVQFPLQPASFKGDIVDGIAMLTPGDSAIFRVPIDTLLKAGSPSLPWMKEKSGQMMEYNVTLVSVKTMDQMKSEQEAAASKQKEIDDKAIQDYFQKNNIKATKTASGLYYKIDNPGTGEQATAGKSVTVNYTGKTMDGETFDSNVDPKFQHVSPFTFNLGQGQVIRGWDEGVALMKKGSKGTLYIPSPLAYGANGQGPIKPNSILIFDIEVTDVK